MGGIFTVVLQSPLGPRTGTLSLCRSGTALRGMLSLFGTENPIAEGAVNGNRYTFSGNVATAAGVREYKAVVTVANGALCGEIVFYLRTVPVKIPLPVPMRLTGSLKLDNGR